MNKITKILKKYRKLIILVLLIMIILCLSLLAIGIFKRINPKKELPDSPSSFFLENDKGYYSLFNKKGKQLIDSSFIRVNEFYNEVSKVKDKDSKYGIVNEKGKYIVKLGQYENIYQYGSLFKVEEDSKYSLLNKNGKKIIKKADFNVETFTGIDSFIVVSYNDKYIIYNYDGKKIYSFKISDDKNMSGPSANELGKYGSVYYDGLTIIFNIASGKVMAKIKEDIGYCVSSTNEDESIISLKTCKSWYEEAEDIKYKVIIKNKLKDIKEKCSKLTLNDNILICTQDNARYMLNKKLEKVNIKVNDATYYNYKTYAIKKDNDIQFVKNNKVKSTLKDAILADKGYTSQGIYLTYKDDKYTYYNIKGKALFKNSYKNATAFDSNGLALVSKDEDKYYLINTKGKKVSPDFTTANIDGNYYTYSNDDLYGILSKEGKVLVENKYTSVSIRGINDHYYVVGNLNDKEYELIDLETRKIVLKTNEPMILHDSYIAVAKDDKLSYYTYKGKEFNK